MPFSRALLWLVAVVFALFGVAFALRPEELVRMAEIQATTPTARVDIAALYGGMELGIAGFLAYCALEAGRVRVGLVAAASILAGIALVRGIGILIAHPVRPVLYLFLALELLGAALAAWAAGRNGDIHRSKGPS